MDTTDIEKKSLEAHVELCAERYKLLELKLETVESTVDSLRDTIEQVHNIVQGMAAKRNDQLINWGIGIIGTLIGTVAWLAVHYFKNS
jgi:3-dehydroquinate synthetase